MMRKMNECRQIQQRQSEEVQLEEEKKDEQDGDGGRIIAPSCLSALITSYLISHLETSVPVLVSSS